jgi:hypothetical protein
MNWAKMALKGKLNCSEKREKRKFGLIKLKRISIRNWTKSSA